MNWNRYTTYLMVGGYILIITCRIRLRFNKNEIYTIIVEYVIINYIDDIERSDEMYSEEELIKKIKKENLDCFKLSDDYEEEDKIIMLDSDLDELIEFAKKRSIGELFYKFAYTSEEVLSITEESMKRTLEKVNMPYKEICEIIQPMVEEYNKKVAKLDFSKPHSLLVFCLYQGRRIGVCEVDLWFIDEQIMLPKYAIDNIVAENEDLINEYIESKQKESELIKEEFREYLLSDEKFGKCSNKSLRSNYALELYKDEKHKHFRKAFINGTDYQRFNEFGQFVEMVWRERKEKERLEHLNFVPKI